MPAGAAIAAISLGDTSVMAPCEKYKPGGAANAVKLGDALAGQMENYVAGQQRFGAAAPR